MKKNFTLFAMLLMVGIAFAEDPTPIVVDNTSFRMDSHGFASFNGYTSDSSTSVYLLYETSDGIVRAGTFPGTVLSKSSTRLITNGTYYTVDSVMSDIVVTIDDNENDPTYNVKVTFRTNHYDAGQQQMLYKTFSVDITFHTPHEVQYHEAALQNVKIANTHNDSVYHKIRLTPNDSKYNYFIYFCESKCNWNGDTVYFGRKDTATFNVYDINDTERTTIIYKHFAGWIVPTKDANDNVTLTGEIICNGNIKFYLNCTKQKAAVKDVAMPTYKVFTEGNSIIVNNATGNRVTIYDATGRLIESSMVNSDRARFSLKTGVYLVRINGSTTKVLCW